MLSWGYDEAEPDWGAGLQVPNPKYPLGQLVAITTTTTGISTTGHHRLVVEDEVGTVTRQGSFRILIRMDRRAKPFSAYFPVDVLTPFEREDPDERQ